MFVAPDAEIEDETSMAKVGTRVPTVVILFPESATPDDVDAARMPVMASHNADTFVMLLDPTLTMLLLI